MTELSWTKLLSSVIALKVLVLRIEEILVPVLVIYVMQMQIQIVFENNGTDLIHQADPQPPGNTFAQLVCYLLLLTY